MHFRSERYIELNYRSETCTSQVTFDEIRAASTELKDELSNIVQAEDLLEIFQLLDSERDERLDINEFVAGVGTSPNQGSRVLIVSARFGNTSLHHRLVFGLF